MEHNENLFAARANKRAMFMWLFMMVILSAAYVIEIVKGLKTVQYFLLMEVCCWVPFIVGLIVLKINGGHLNLFASIICVKFRIHIWCITRKNYICI